MQPRGPAGAPQSSRAGAAPGWAGQARPGPGGPTRSPSLSLCHLHSEGHLDFSWQPGSANAGYGINESEETSQDGDGGKAGPLPAACYKNRFEVNQRPSVISDVTRLWSVL